MNKNENQSPLVGAVASQKSRPWFKMRFVSLSVILVATVVCVLLVFNLPRLLMSPYVSFKENNDQHYFSEMASACNLMLKQHSRATNTTTAPNVGATASIEPITISSDDASLPKIIRRLHPNRVVVLPGEVTIYVGIESYSSNGVLIPIRTAGYGITWAPRYGSKDVWELTAFADEGESTVVYTESNK